MSPSEPCIYYSCIQICMFIFTKILKYACINKNNIELEGKTIRALNT